MKHSLGCGFLLAGLASLPVQAEDDWQLALGVGAMSEKSLYRGIGTDSNVLPLIMVEKGNFHLRGNELQYDLFESGAARFSVLGQYRFEGYEASDSSVLTGMAKRDGAFELGLGVELDSGYGDWSLQALTDISSNHRGHELSLGWSQDLELSPRWQLTPSAGLSYRSGKLNDYYFGVRDSEATATRAAYRAGSGTVFSLGVDATYTIDPQQMIRLGISVDHYGNEISDSPIVERSNSPQFKVGYLYRF